MSTVSSSTAASQLLNKAKGNPGGYSKLAQAKHDAQQREQMEKLEGEKYKERNIIKEKKQREKYVMPLVIL